MLAVRLAWCDDIRFVNNDKELFDTFLEFDEKCYCEFSFNVQPTPLDVIVPEQPQVFKNTPYTQPILAEHFFAQLTSKCAFYLS